MHCRAYILLERDFKDLYDNDYEGITASPVSEDLMTWEAEIEGLQNSIWHGFIFQLIIHFTPEYNVVPPVVKFITIPFHPNVDPYSGQPSVDFLDNRDKWNTSYTLSSILLSLQVLLSNPVLDNPVNLEAAQLLIRDESVYRTVVQKLFQESLQRHGSSELSEDTHTRIRITDCSPFCLHVKICITQLTRPIKSELSTGLTCLIATYPSSDILCVHIILPSTSHCSKYG